jgi:protein-L-isoaspartate(D-aspartate) O-methyltransferase
VWGRAGGLEGYPLATYRFPLEEDRRIGDGRAWGECRSAARPLLTATLLLAWLASAATAAEATGPLAAARNRMVDQEILAAGVTNPRVICALRETPRHLFVARGQRQYAYYDMALPIGAGQTISPPFVVAYMTAQLDPQPSDRVLEVGTGSGYQAAVLSRLVAEVDSIEIVESLGRRAAATLKRLRYSNVHVRIGDGFQGWPERAPFDKILVTCSPEDVPPALVAQLKEGGRMVVPVGQRYQQTLYLYRKRSGKLSAETLRPTLFVPMTGTAEQQRRTQPDPRRPELVGGSFETLMRAGQQPLGWHYVRQMERVEDPAEAPDGDFFSVFSNETPGRGSQALQGFAVDGREVAHLRLSVHVRGEALRYGQDREQWPGMVVTFYGPTRAVVGQASLGPWLGTFPWRLEQRRLPVPLKAREAICRVGLLGGTGRLSIDSAAIAAAQ